MQAYMHVPADAVYMEHWQAIRMNSWQEGTIHDLSCHIACPNTKREGRLHLAKGIETDHLAKLNADNKHVTASHTLSNCQEQASQAS